MRSALATRVTVLGKRKAKRKLALVVKPAQPKSLLEVIAEAARDPAVDVGKMQALLKMKEHEEDRQSEILFNNALADAKQGMPVIAKDAKGDRNIAYATLEKVSKALDPILQRHGFTVTFGMADSPSIERYRITAELRHRAGYKKEYFADIPESITGPKGAPIMTKAQGAGAAIAFGRRYLKLMIFDIPIAGEDTNAASPPEVLDMDEVMALQKLMTKAKADTQKFCDYFQISAVPDLPKARLPEANRLLNKMVKGLEGKS